jgi:putative transcriptional regulator
MSKRIRSRLRSLIEGMEFREGRKVTYKEIHEATGISISALSEFGTNKTVRYHDGLLAALCEFFNCDVGDLLTYVPPNTSDTTQDTDE